MDEKMRHALAMITQAAYRVTEHKCFDIPLRLHGLIRLLEIEIQSNEKVLKNSGAWVRPSGSKCGCKNCDADCGCWCHSE